MNAAERTEWIEHQARSLGFDLCGITAIGSGGNSTTSSDNDASSTSADNVWPELARIPEWLARGNAGELKYLHDPRRTSPEQVMPGARSVIVCALNYNSAQLHSTDALPGGRSFSSDIKDGKRESASAAEAINSDSPRGWISRYAWGTDYHEIIGAKLAALEAAMRAEIHEPFNAKWYVDTGPIHERAAAHHAGLGWIGKHTLLINQEIGSWIFLGVIVTTLELAPTLSLSQSTRATESLPPDLCGQCTLCIDACPTDAIVEPYVLDARKCISYLTIELRSAIPEELREQMGRQVFGCDICQDVCPWNRQAPATQEKAFAPREKLLAPELEWLASLSEEGFRREFRASPVKRAKFRGLIRNACVALGNSKLQRGAESHARVSKLLERLSSSEDALIAEHASWALGRLS
jgi:epoxyqueuosine reductase